MRDNNNFSKLVLNSDFNSPDAAELEHSSVRLVSQILDGVQLRRIDVNHQADRDPGMRRCSYEMQYTSGGV